MIWRKKKKERNQYDLRNGGFLKIGVFLFMAYVLAFDFFKVGIGENGIEITRDNGSENANFSSAEISGVRVKKADEAIMSGLNFVTVKEGGGDVVSWCGSKLFLGLKAVSLKGKVIEDTTKLPKIVIVGDGELDIQLEKNLFDMRVGEAREVIIDSVSAENKLVKTKIAYNVELVDMENSLMQDSAKLFKYIRERIGSGSTVYCGDDVSVKYKSFSSNGDVLEDKQLDLSIGGGALPRLLEKVIMQMQKGEKGTAIIPSKVLSGYEGEMKIPNESAIIIELEVL